MPLAYLHAVMYTTGMTTRKTPQVSKRLPLASFRLRPIDQRRLNGIRWRARAGEAVSVTEALRIALKAADEVIR